MDARDEEEIDKASFEAIIYGTSFVAIINSQSGIYAKHIRIQDIIGTVQEINDSVIPEYKFIKDQK